MPHHITPDHLRAALTLRDFDGYLAQAPMAPLGRERHQPAPPPNMPPARQAAVLVLLYPHADDFHIVLTRRQEHLRGHSGQISFPGGRADDDDDNFVQTALRETCEELGVCDYTPLHVLGMLTKVYIPPSNHDVHPVVALTDRVPDLKPNPDEVAEAFTLSLTRLLDPHIKGVAPMSFGAQTYQVPHYEVNGHHVWGATAAILSEFEQRLCAVL